MPLDRLILNASRKSAKREITQKIKRGDYEAADAKVGNRVVAGEAARNRAGSRSAEKGEAVFTAELEVEKSAVAGIAAELPKLAEKNPKRFVEALRAFSARMSPEDVPDSVKGTPPVTRAVAAEVAHAVAGSSGDEDSLRIIKNRVEPFSRLGIVRVEDVYANAAMREAAQRNLEKQQENINKIQRRGGGTQFLEKRLNDTKNQFRELGILGKE
jgi:hypothetical protein